MTDLLTVKEFAAKANVSVQAIYQRLDRDLKPYLKTIKGKKYLSVEGLQLFVKDDSTSVKQVLNKLPLNDFKEDTETADNATIELLKETLKALQEQLNVKDEQIREKDKQISDLALSLKAEQKHSAQLTMTLSQQQALHAGTIKQQLAEQHEPNSDLQAQEEQPTQKPVEDPPKKKLSFFQKIFRRKEGE